MRISHINEYSAIVVVPGEGNHFTGREDDCTPGSNRCSPRMVTGGAAVISAFNRESRFSSEDLQDPEATLARYLRIEEMSGKAFAAIDPGCVVSLITTPDTPDIGVQVAGLLIEQRLPVIK